MRAFIGSLAVLRIPPENLPKSNNLKPKSVGAKTYKMDGHEC